MNNNYCPKINYSCCTRQDFAKTQRLWDKKARDIKKYITKLFRVIQKITVYQSSLLNLANEVKQRETDNCREIDFTFFNSPIKYSEVYFYLENALEAFAYLQKGFYCMICNAENHEYMAIEMGFTRRVNVISHKFCNNLIFFFREFIMFKVYYFDPLIVNTNLLFNCYENEELYDFNLFYNTTFQNIESCVEKGENCEYVCKEFKFGTASELFIGKLSNYYEFLERIERVIQKFDPNVTFEDKEISSEFFIEDKMYNEEFFLDTEQVISEQNYFVLKDYNMTQFEINVEEEGINLFDVSIESNFFLTNALTTSIAEKNYGTKNPGQDNEINGGNKLDSYTNENDIPESFQKVNIVLVKQEETEELEREKTRIEESENNPDSSDLLKLSIDIEAKERAADALLRESANDMDTDLIDYNDDDNFSPIWQCTLFIFITIYLQPL